MSSDAAKLIPHAGKRPPAYCVMRTARCADELESEMMGAGEAFFHVSGAGDEGSAAKRCGGELGTAVYWRWGISNPGSREEITSGGVKTGS